MNLSVNRKFRNVAIREDVHKLIKIHVAKTDTDLGQYVSDVMQIAVRSKIVIPKKTKGIRFQFVETKGK